MGDSLSHLDDLLECNNNGEIKGQKDYKFGTTTESHI